MARTEADDVLSQALLRAGADIAIVAQPTPLRLCELVFAEGGGT